MSYPGWLSGAIVSLSICATILSGCEESLNSPYIVVSEEVFYVSSEQVRLIGRVISKGEQPIQDHGFEIDLTESFSSSIKTSLGGKSNVGRFIGEFSGLTSDTQYYWRSYIETDDRVILGEVKSFKTLTPGLTDFSPKYGQGGDVMVINGKNFSQDAEVYFGARKAEIEEIVFESLIRVKVPPIANAAFEGITVKLHGTEITFDTPFEYITGRWEKVADFVNNLQLTELLVFNENQYMVVGLGRDVNTAQNNPTIWSLDLETLQWSDLNFTGQQANAPFSAHGYFGSGAIAFGFSSITISNEFWRHNEGQLTKLSSLPFQLYKSVAVKHNEYIYVVGGQTTSRSNNFQIYGFNTNTQVWSTNGFSPLPVSSDNANFTFLDKHYFVLNDGRILQFNPQTNAWGQVASYIGGAFDNRGVAVALQDKMYLGLTFGRDFWEYNPATNQWKRKNNFSGTGNYANLGYFTYNGYIYILRRYTGPQVSQWPRLSLWKFDPNAW
jgi:hypothetical protein